MADYDASIRVNTKVDNSDLGQLQKDFDKLERKLEELHKKGDKFEALGVNKQSKQWQALRYDVAQTENALEDARERIQEINELNTGKPESGFSIVRNAANGLFKTIKKGTKQSNGLLVTMGSRLKGIALSLLVFNWISKGFNAMVSAMKEGFQNLAQYSKDYNTAMSDLKSGCAELKNNLAAAFEPVATAIVPYITQLISWLNVAADAVARFLAVISGKNTYTRAKKQVVDYAKSLKDANNTAKGTLAAFDSINVLSKDEGSVNTGGEVAGADAFETVSLTDEDMQMVDRLKEVLFDILNILIPIGLAMAIFGVGGPLGTFAGVLLIVIGLLETILEYTDAWANGISFDNLTGMTKGLLAVLLGVYLLLGPMAAGFVAIVGGIALVVLAIKDMIENGVNMQNSITIIIGLVMALIGIFVAFGSTTAVVVAAVIGAIALVVLAIKDMIQNGVNMQNCILLVIGVVGALIAIFMLFGSTAALIVAAVVAVIAIFVAMIEMAGNGEEAIATLKSMCKNFADFFKKIFAGDIEGALESLKAAGIDFVNIVIIAFESLVNCLIKGINWLIDRINSISFDVPEWVPVIGGQTLSPDIPHVSEVSLPRLATGGIADRPTAAVFGEAGREAVLPLERNTEWMDSLADKLAERIPTGNTGPVYLQIDGQTFARIEGPYLNSENARIGLNLKNA